MFFEHQIRILERFQKDLVTLKTAVMVAEISILNNLMFYCFKVKKKK